MGNFKTILRAFIALIILGSTASAQEGLSIYGFFQASAFHVKNDYTFKTTKLGYPVDQKKSEVYT